MACETVNMVKPHALIVTRGVLVVFVNHSESMESYVAQGSYLESTGVTRQTINKTIYAAPQRCDRALEDYAKRIGYSRVVSFQTALPS